MRVPVWSIGQSRSAAGQSGVSGRGDPKQPLSLAESSNTAKIPKRKNQCLSRFMFTEPIHSEDGSDIPLAILACRGRFGAAQFLQVFQRCQFATFFQRVANKKYICQQPVERSFPLACQTCRSSLVSAPPHKRLVVYQGYRFAALVATFKTSMSVCEMGCPICGVKFPSIVPAVSAII